MVGALLWSALAMAAPCDEPIDAATLESRALAAEQAWADMESDAFVAQARALGGELSCVSDALYPEQVAAWFRVQGMLHFYEGDQARALQEFHAALANDPSWQLSSDLAGPDHPLRALVDEARERDTTWTPLGKPTDGWLRVDGTGTEQAPENRPWVFQRIAGDGALAQTVRVGPSQDPPAYETGPSWSAARADRRILRAKTMQNVGRVSIVAGPASAALGFALYNGLGSDPVPLGEVLIGVGVVGAVAAPPLANFAVARERRLLADYGYHRPVKVSVVLSWALYAASWGSLVYSVRTYDYLSSRPLEGRATIPLWAASVVLSFVAVEQNRAWERKQRAQVGLGVLPTAEGARVGLVVRGW